MEATRAYLEVRGLAKAFGSDRAVDGISFSVQRGEFLTLLGPSGCGKTTTLMCIAGLHVPDRGEVLLEGAPLTSVERGILVPPERRAIGMVFQSYAIWPHMTVAQNVAYPLEVRKIPPAEVREMVAEALRRVRMLEFLGKPATHLSGGQQQRVAVARAIVFNPRLLLFDEPLSNLDAKLREEVRVELTRLQHELGITSLYVTHDQAEAMALSDRILVMSKGRIEQEGDPRSIYARPANRFVSEFIGVANIFPGRLAEADGRWGVAEVENGEGTHRFRCQLAAPFVPGESLVLSIRPEDVRIAPEGEENSRPSAGGEPNRVRGEVRDAIFLGGYTDCRVRWGDLEWKVQVHQRRRFRPGDRVALAVWPEHCLGLRG